MHTVWLSLPLETPLTPRPNNPFASGLTCTFFVTWLAIQVPLLPILAIKYLWFLAEVFTFEAKYSAQKLPVIPVKFLRCFCSNSHHTTQTTSTKVAQQLFVLIMFLLLYFPHFSSIAYLNISKIWDSVQQLLMDEKEQ